MTARIQQLISFLKEKYDIDVVIDDFKDDIDIGALSGKKILVNKKSRDEIGVLFVIAHLFGHMVQFTNYEKYKHLVEEVEKEKPIQPSVGFREAFYEYEREGYRIGKGLLQKVLGKKETEYLDEKLQIYLDTDFETFWEYITTGKQISITQFNVLLNKHFIEWSGKYSVRMQSIDLPEEVDPKKDTVVY